MYEEAIARFQKAVPLAQGNGRSMTLAGLGHVYAASGKKVEARAQLTELERVARQEYVSAVAVALIYAGLGEKDQAFTWLEKAYEERAFELTWLKVEPRWDSLRSDPRFANLLRRMGLEQ
jgi:Flp pilus assembly protein TadD